MGKAKELAELANNLTVSGGAVTVSGFNYDNIVDSAPGALNTLNELAAALGDDANFSTTVTSSIATKLPLSGGAMTGPITTNSTFDGVDIATRDAVLTATTTTANAALPLAGGTVTGDVTFGDNNKAIFGDGSDLKIYHDGSNNYIQSLNAGWLNIPITGNGISIANADFTENLLKILNNGAVELYHNGSKKLETTSTGIDVTGTANISNTLTANSLSIPSQGIILNQAFGTGVPSITMTGTANNGRAGAINFKESDGSGGAIADTAAIYSTDGVGGNSSYGGLTIVAYQSDLRFSTGTLGDTKAIIKADGKVGIGTTSPPAALSVYGNEATGMGISIHDDGWGGANGLYMMTVQNSNGAFVVRKNTANALDFSTSQNQLEVGHDGVRAIGYGNSATGDNVSVEYTGTAGGHQSGYLFRDKRDVVNAAVKNYLLDDGVGTAAASLEFYTSDGGTLTKQMNIDRYGYIDTTNPRFSVGAAPNARTGKTGIRVGRTIINWFNYGRNDGNDYLHIKTNLTNIVGSNPQATMSSFHIRGYTYSTETIDSILGFHNWSGTYYSQAYRNNGSRTVVSASWAPYRSTDNKVVIVLNIGNNYPGISIDYMQNFEYTWHDVEVSAYSKSASTSGVY